MDPRMVRSAAAAGRKKSTGSGRAKAVSILMREELKSDKRQALADALTAKLTAKYAKNDMPFAASIASMTSRLFLNSTRRILEADVVAFEAVVRKMSLEREQARAKDKPGKSGGSGAVGTSSGLAAAGASAVGNTSAKGNASSDPLAGAQDEWVLLNALTLVEYESEQERTRTMLEEKKRTQRAWLDAQQQDKACRAAGEKNQEKQAFIFQQSDVAKWRVQESAKKQQIHDQALKVRREQDEQLRQQKAAEAAREETRRQQEAAEVARVQNELKRLEEDAKRRREQERARMRVVQAENALEQQRKAQLQKLEQEEDVQLMEAYAQRLAREDEERVVRLRGRVQRQGQRHHGIVESLQEQIYRKTKEEERRAEEFQRQKDAAQQLKEQTIQEQRRVEALERQQFLLQQREQKKQRERQEVEEDRDFARQYHSEGRAALDKQKQQLKDVRARNKEFQEKLIEQMEEQRAGQPMSPLHLPRALMNSREKRINAKLLQKLEDDELGQKVRQKLSPVRPGGNGDGPAISTSFY